MGSVVSQLEPLGRPSFGKLDGVFWSHGERKTHREEKEMELEITWTGLEIPIGTDYLGQVPRNSTYRLHNARSAAKHDTAALPTGFTDANLPVRKIPPSVTICAAGTAALHRGSERAPGTFTKCPVLLAPVPPTRHTFKFPPQERSTSRRAVKRRRSDTDVDGPNTASLCCKKRRILRELITSRLSEPYSLPATHILSREMAVGDKRFLKLAAILTARRLSSAVPALSQHYQPNPSSMLRRAAVINKFRLRVRNDATQRGDEELAHLAANATLLLHSQGFGTVVDSRFPAAQNKLGLPLPPSVVTPGTGGRPVPLPMPPLLSQQPHPLSRAAAEVRQGSPPGSSIRPGARKTSLSPRTSPRTRPLRSPESAPFPMLSLDECDDECAFPTSDLDSCYEDSDDPDDMYADFDVIFGSGMSSGTGAGVEEGREPGLGGSDDELGSERDHFEEYMDDLDGIPWGAR